MNKKLFILPAFLLLGTLAFFAGYLVRGNFAPKQQSENSLVNKIIPRPLDAYSIENLSKISYSKGELIFKRDFVVDKNSSIEEMGYKSQVFNFKFPPNPESKEQKSTSILINTPIEENTEKKFPLVLMLRGYVDPTNYISGIGTKRAGEVFVKNGFITVAPDFLGYAESDINSSNIFESRFQTYTTVLSLLNSIDTTSLPEWNGKDIFIWAHSNGGQIALTTLEITGRDIPTVLWAPVSKPFPYSILYYTDESQDKGKLIRRELAKFEDIYDTDRYSLDMYMSQIGSKSVGNPKAHFQIHQGTADDAIPQEWTDKLVKDLKSGGIDVSYFVYHGSDHNLQPAWNTAVTRSLEFYNKYLKN